MVSIILQILFLPAKKDNIPTSFPRDLHLTVVYAGLTEPNPLYTPFRLTFQAANCRYQITLLRENGQKITGLKLLQVLLNKLNFILQVIWIDLNDLDLTG